MLADLQVHTPADKEHRYGDVGGPAPNAHFARALIRAHRDAGVGIIAVTDHNRLDWWPALRDAGEDLGVFVFPGLEINVNKCHLLALWDRTDQAFALAQRFLQGLFDPGVDPLTESRQPRPVPTGSVLDWARKARELQALVLAPHSTAKKMGLFGTNVCNISSEVAQSGLVLGFDVFGNTGADVLVNPAAEFGGVEPAWFLSGDLRSLDEAGDRAVFLKVGAEPTLESLRQAFLMPRTRVRFPKRLHPEWSHVKHASFLDTPQSSWPRIQSVTIQGGFHNELELQFGPGLNAIIGGKGTGKSTLVEILRYVMEAADSIAPASQVKDGVGNREKNFPGNAEARVDYIASGGQQYWVTRVGNSPGSRLFRGTEPLEIDLSRRVQIRVFGQRELAALPEQQDALAAFIFDPASESAKLANSNVSTALQETRRLAGLLDGLDVALAATEEASEGLRDLNDRLDQLTKQGASALVEESAALGEADTAVQMLSKWPDELEIGLTALREASVAPELPEHHLLSPAFIELRDETSVAVEQSSTSAVTAVEALRDGLQPHVADWQQSVRHAREDLGRRLSDAGLADADELAKLQDRKATLVREVSGTTNHEHERAELLPQRQAALDELAAARRARSRLIETAALDLNSRTGDRVRVVVEPLSDPEPTFDFISEHVTQRKLTAEQRNRLVNLSGIELANGVGKGKQELLALGMTATMSDRFMDLEASKLRRLEEVDRPDAVRVEVDLSEEGDQRWTPLSEVSPGQAATAMLALALVAGDEPLIIDQPEDDLDNRFIYDEIVQQIADVATRRQVIVATHNANIPVLGDAELVVALEATTERGTVLACGGLDDPEVAITARNILEGGVEAFEARARRYG